MSVTHPSKCEHEQTADGATHLVCLDCGATWRWHVRYGVGRWVYVDKRGRSRFARNPSVSDPTRIEDHERIAEGT